MKIRATISIDPKFAGLIEQEIHRLSEQVGKPVSESYFFNILLCHYFHMEPKELGTFRRRRADAEIGNLPIVKSNILNLPKEEREEIMGRPDEKGLTQAHRDMYNDLMKTETPEHTKAILRGLLEEAGVLKLLEEK